jgi:hypothetical protein
MLGTTWYERGLAYWLRRVLMSLFLFMVLAFLLWPLGYAFWLGLGSERLRIVSIVLLVAMALVSAAAGIYTWRHSGYRAGPPPQPVSIEEARHAGAVGAAVGLLARAAGIAAPFVLIGSVLLVGPLTALFVRVTFTRELAVERRARERLTQQRQGRAPSGSVR